MKTYSHKEVEGKWQSRWEKEKVFAVKEDLTKEKFYALVEFPYPSGAGLHVGHPLSYTALDVISRKRRMEGYNVLYPMGFDAFGLPAENYAIKTGRPPAEVTAENIQNFTRQLKSLGFGFDWDRAVNTTDPEYYKWTQWIFLQFFKHGLAYQDETMVWWCEELGTVLANEEVIDGKSERGGHLCERRPFSQWMLAITKYADSLLKGLEEVDYINQAKVQQTNWIGKSEGALVQFSIKDTAEILDVFTTRPDTLFGVTYMVIAPEHELLNTLKNKIHNNTEIAEYIMSANGKSDLERAELQKDKTGVCIDGIVCINPINGEEIPVYVADYVLMSYGTGAIMAVPAHDQRDFEFAKKYGIEIKEVITSEVGVEEGAYQGDGFMKNSGFLDGLTSGESISKAIDYLEVKEVGQRKINYKLRDWVFSRQRYWGEPFPIVWVDSDDYSRALDLGKTPVTEWLPKSPIFSQVEEREYVAMPIAPAFLPITLPKVDSFEPKGAGESALATAEEWVQVWYNIETGETCSRATSDSPGENWVEARRETDTMPNWAGSSWYFLRYCDPHNGEEFASEKALKYWMQVDWYNGGMEHTVLHLLYSRFWNQFLYDIGVVPFKEPYKKRTSHGMILAEDGEKMSKSRGNVVNPDDIVDSHGADVLRSYIMFMGPFEQAVAWDVKGLQGVRRFLDRIWSFQDKVKEGYIDSEYILKNLYKTIDKVSSDIEDMGFNTALAAMMEFSHDIVKAKCISMETFMSFIKLLSPFAPHMAEELWNNFGNEGMICLADWPVVTERQRELLAETHSTMVIQVNGKVRGEITVPIGIDEVLLKAQVQDIENVKKYLENKTIQKIIVIPNKLVSIVVS